MQKTISSSGHDTIVIKQEDRTYRSTPFQVVFSSNLIKQIEKNRAKHKNPPYKLSMTVNDRPVDINIKIDQSGRIVFEKIYNRKLSMVSDSSDVSDEDHSHKSSNKTFDTRISRAKNMLEEYKNEQAPTTKFWQFAWLFSHKKDESPSPNLYKIEEDEANNQSNLTKIKQQIYEGEQHSKQPLFHLSLCGNLLKKKQTKQQILKTFYEHRVEYSQFIKDPPGYINDTNLIVKIDDSIYTWQLGITILTCRFAYGRDLTKQQIEDIIKNKFTKSRLFSFISGGSNITKLDIAQYENQANHEREKELRRIKKAEKPVVKYKKTPDSDILKKMKLKYGKNIGKFELDVGDGVKETVIMKIFLWDRSEKIVISDIDGTITRSDILGQILSKWIHSGVTKLFTQIYKRHYKIIYLTARAIGQYQQTSKFLETVEQQNVFLPEGPLMMSPDGYMRSFTREIIYKTPDYLKTKILASLNQVFPNTKNPIYCGFGNRETDSTAYLKINISPDKIYCITEKSVISRESDKDFNSSYKDILANINEFFPEYFKDVAMVDSSSEEDLDEDYQAVEPIQEGKKSKSVDGDRMRNQKRYEMDELSDIGNLSKSRKSEHQIRGEDIQALEQMKQLQTKQLEQLENYLMNYEGGSEASPTKGSKESPIKPYTGIKMEKQKQIGTETSEKMKQVSKEELENIMMKQLKEDNEVSQNEVIPNTVQQTNPKSDNNSEVISENSGDVVR